MNRIGGDSTDTARRDLDFYPTDHRWVDVLLRHEIFANVISEPCCGDEAISKRLVSKGFNVQSADIKDYGYPGTFVTDAMNARYHEQVITNPPYLSATKLIDHWLNTTSGKVAVLMRLGYLESKSRYKHFRERRPHRIKHVDSFGFEVSSQFPHAWLVRDNNRPNVNRSEFVWDTIS